MGSHDVDPPKSVIQVLSRGAGRPAAALILLLALAAMAILEAGTYSVIPRTLFDLYQRIAPRQVERIPAIIIDVDEQSLAEFGQWPWPRTLTARLVESVAQMGPLAIGLDIIMPEPDRLSPEAVAALHPGMDEDLKRSLADLPSNDIVLGNTLSKFNVVVARAGLHDARSHPSPQNYPRSTVMTDGPGGGSHLLSFDGVLLNVPEIEAGALGFGLVNTRRDRDGVVRSVPLVMNLQGRPQPSLALELLRVAIGANWITLHTDENGVRGVGLGDSFVPTESDARITLRFSPSDTRRRLSAADVLNGRTTPGQLDGQVALIGVTALGLTDVVPTPVDGRMDGVEVHAQAIENILTGGRLTRPAHARWIEALCLIVLSVLMIVLLPRAHPALGATLMAGLVCSSLLASFSAFAWAATLYDPVYPSATLVLIYMVLLSAMLADANRKRRALNAELEREKLAGARMAGELGAAREIQMGMLPNPNAIEGLPDTVRLHAMLEPAREVGGDLYDIYMINDTQLFFMIGDVSGKGVPASLFMALSKALCKNVALRAEAPVGEITSEVNDAISRENPAELFVTAVAGVLDVTNGKGEICVAGHDAPFLLRPGDAPRDLETVGGPPLCVLEGFPYPTERFRLDDGDMLVLWTDGVSEAQSSKAKEVEPNDRLSFYGRSRIRSFLEGLPSGSTPSDLVNGLYHDAKRFSEGAESIDDITIVAIQYVG